MILSLNGILAGKGGGMVMTNILAHYDASNIASYPGSGNIWYDISGNNYNSLTSSDPSTYPTFSSLNSGKFIYDGVNDYHGLPFMPYGTQNLTIQTWIRCSSQTGSFFSQGMYPANTAGGFHLFVRDSLNGLSNSVTWFVVTDWSASKYKGIITNSNVFTNNVWFNVGVTWNYSTKSMKIYINGVEQGTNTFASSGTDLNGTLTPNNQFGRAQSIGTYDESRIGNLQYNGDVGSLIIYNTELNSSQILGNFNATKTRFGL